MEYKRNFSYLPVKEGDAIVVTGAHTGIGKHAALTLAKQGFTVFCGVRKPEHGDELLRSAAKFEIDESKVRPILLDVTKPDQVYAAVQQVSAFVGEEEGLYGLFNNAGIVNTVKENKGLSVEYVPMDAVREVFEVNFFGLLRVTKAFLPLIRRRQGRILTNTSLAGKFATIFMSAYTSSKFAVEGLMDSLRRELLGLGVKVSILEPGLINTPILNGLEKTFEFEGEGVYATDEMALFRNYVKKCLVSAQSPQVTSEAVVHAMRAPLPKTRYVVGGLSGTIKFLSSIPDKWADALVEAALKNADTATEDELTELLERINAEFHA